MLLVILVVAIQDYYQRGVLSYYVGEIVEIVQNQKDGRQIAPSRSPLKDLSVYGEVGDPTAVSDGYGKFDAHLPRFFSVSFAKPMYYFHAVDAMF